MSSVPAATGITLYIIIYLFSDKLSRGLSLYLRAQIIKISFLSLKHLKDPTPIYLFDLRDGANTLYYYFRCSGSPLSSATPRLLSSALDAPVSSASPLEDGPGKIVVKEKNSDILYFHNYDIRLTEGCSFRKKQ